MLTDDSQIKVEPLPELGKVNPESCRQIGVAIVRHGSKVLVGVRPEGVPLGGFAEFPGGKCEVGETPRQCVVRECLEETGLEIIPLDALLTDRYDYPHGSVHLHFWLCAPALCENVRARHRNFFWVEIADLPNWRFPAGNLPVLKMIRSFRDTGSGGN